MFDSLSHIRQGNYTLAPKMTLGHVFLIGQIVRPRFTGICSKTRPKNASN